MSWIFVNLKGNAVSFKTSHIHEGLRCLSCLFYQGHLLLFAMKIIIAYEHNPSSVVLVFCVLFHFLHCLKSDNIFMGPQMLAERARFYIANTQAPGIELDALYKLKSEVAILSLF